MGERLKNILTVNNLGPGSAITLQHDLKTSQGTPLAPDIVYIPSADIAVDSSPAGITLLNTGNSPVSGFVLVEAWHTIERGFADVNDVNLTPKPYVVVNGCCDNEPEIIYLAANQLSKQPPVAGNGDSFTFAAGVVTLTDAAGLFTAGMVGQLVQILGATSPGNDGSFEVASFIDANNITYANPNGVTEAYVGAWTVNGNGSPASQGLLINPNGGTPDGIAVIEINPTEANGFVVPQPQPEGWDLPVAPFRNPIEGTGDSFTAAAGVVTLTDAAGLFTASMVGAPIEIAGATTPANNGSFIVASFIDANNITYANAAGVTEVFPGTWIVSGSGGSLVYYAEAHHFNISADKTRLLAFGINNNFAYVYDISGPYKKYPKLIASTKLDVSDYMGPHDCAELGDGTFLVTMSGNMTAIPMGSGPGGLIRIDRDGNYLNNVMAPNHTFFDSAAISIAVNQNGILAYPEFQTHYYYDQWPPGTLEVGHEVVLFNYNVNAPGVITPADLIQSVTLTGGGFDGFQITSPTWLPGPLNGQEVLFATAVSSGLWVLTRAAGSSDPFVPRLIYQLPVGPGYPEHATMHVIVMTVGDTDELKYDKIYLSDTWGNALHVLELSNGLPPPGQFYSAAPNSPFQATVISNPNIHWMAFDKSGSHIYTSNMLYSIYDFNLGKYPPVTTYELRRFSVDTTGALTPTPDFSVLAPEGYGFVKFKIRNGATFPGTHE